MDDEKRNRDGLGIPAQDDGQYFIIGKNRIIITEHFRGDGGMLPGIMEKLILDAAKRQENP